MTCLWLRDRADQDCQGDVPGAWPILKSRSLAETGDPEFQMGMAFLYATGSVVTSSQSQALLYYTFGAFGGSQRAQMALSYRYWSGMGAATSCEKALDYYRRVAQAVAAAAYRGSDSRMRRRTEVRAAGCWTTT